MARLNIRNWLTTHLHTVADGKETVNRGTPHLHTVADGKETVNRHINHSVEKA
jgi:hypothetical protein